MPPGLDFGKSRALLETHILTGCDFTSKVGSKLSSINAEPENICTTEEAPEDDYVSHQAEKYHMKVAESNLSVDDMYQQKNNTCWFTCNICAIQGHLLFNKHFLKASWYYQINATTS